MVFHAGWDFLYTEDVVEFVAERIEGRGEREARVIAASFVLYAALENTCTCTCFSFNFRRRMLTLCRSMVSSFHIVQQVMHAQEA